MSVRVVLVDVNPKVIDAWGEVFEDNPEVDIVQGSMLDQRVDAWVCPTNSRGAMDGGLDGAVKKHLGPKIQLAVQSEIARLYRTSLPLGHAVCVPTGVATPRYLVSTATMGATAEDISDTLNVALACSAALQRVQMANAAVPGSITSVALPGIGTNAGKVPADICADLMWTAYDLFRSRAFIDFASMRVALEQRLGALGNAVVITPSRAAPAPRPPVLPPKLGPSLPARHAPVIPPRASPMAPAKPVRLDDFDDHE